MLNTGATSHIGPNRMYVDLARYWAARGYVVLRLDLAGIGDSNTRPGEVTNQVYPPGAIYDIGVAIEFLRRQCAVSNITLAGPVCRAYHSLRSAVSGLPVDTVLLVNPLTFYWKHGSTLNDLQISEVVRNPGVYAENAFSPRHWSKLLRGQVNMGAHSRGVCAPGDGSRSKAGCATCADSSESGFHTIWDGICNR